MQRALTHAVAGAILIFTTTVLVACVKEKEATGPDVVTDGVTDAITSDAHILGLLHEANTGEIDAGQLAAQRSAGRDVKAFAASMVTEHTDLDTQAMELAAQLAITPLLPNDELPVQHVREAFELSPLTGAAFDSHYVEQQVIAHTRLLSIVDASMAVVRQPALRTMLRNVVRPHVAAHLAEVEKIRDRLGSR